MAAENIGAIIIAMLLLSLVPLTARLLRLRIRFFRWLHWNWGADLIEDHFDSWVQFVRTVLIVIAVALIFVGLTQ
jgi:DNA-binding SARP family transcriptional activator